MSAAGHADARRSRAGRWFAALVTLAVAGAATVLLGGPAQAGASTYDAQLSMTGVATAASPVGGDTIGVHPGDAVKFSASATPTAGLANIPGIGSTLITLLETFTSGTFQVQVTFDKGFPSVGGKTIKLGGPTSGTCGSKSAKSSITVRFPAKGTYGFHWTVKRLVVVPGIPLLSSATCHQSNVLSDLTSTDLNQLKAAGIAINATNGWQGKVISAKKPPKGGIGVQLPSVGASPSLPVVGKLPGVHIPGVTTPTLPTSLPGGGTGSGSGGSGKNGGGGKYKYTPPVRTVPQMVVPNGGAGGGATNGYVVPQGQVEFGSGPHIAGTDNVASGSSIPTSAAAAAHKQPATHLSASSTSGGAAKLPILLAIIAIIALALVTATYARMHLLRRS